MNKLIISLSTAFITLSTLYLNDKDINNIPTDFNNFKSKYGKVYDNHEEDTYRLAVYFENKNKISHHNSQNYSHRLSENPLADLTPEEFKQIYLSNKFEVIPDKDPFVSEISKGFSDWLVLGAVSPVKNQGRCGSCYTFSVTGTLEAAARIFNGDLTLFSEQQIVDCSEKWGNYGCSGGLMPYAFQYVIDKGICTEQSYPYKGEQGTCKEDTCLKSDFKISGYKRVKHKDTKSLQAACDIQPVSVAVAASTWQFYAGGIVIECDEQLNHGVLLTGYNEDKQYWMIKNSWGPEWGEDGFITLSMGNTCGIADGASFPTI